MTGLIPFEKEGIVIPCADGFERRCFPVLAGCLMDYEEQVILTGVKSNRHCTICHVHPKNREILLPDEPPTLRTHESTQMQLELQGSKQINPESTWWLHDINNFAWKHENVNIHRIVMPDILHQLLKGTLEHLLDWLTKILNTSKPYQTKGRATKQTRERARKLISQANGLAQVDFRFGQVPRIGNLKTFPNFSTVSLWTGGEQKCILRQLVVVVTPLLMHIPAVLLCVRAIVDYITLSLYTNHDEHTLRYMHNALQRWELLKFAFIEGRRGKTTKTDEEVHFNYAKFHSPTHFPEQIRLFGALDGYTTDFFEASHKLLVKAYYPLTNRRLDDFQEQIAVHNTERVKMFSMDELLQRPQIVAVSRAEKQLDAHVTSVSTRQVKLSEWGCPHAEGEERTLLRLYRLQVKHFRSVHALAEFLHFPQLPAALCVYLREWSKRKASVESSNRARDKLDEDESRIENVFLALRPNLTCWYEHGKDAADPDAKVSEFVRSTVNWGGSKRRKVRRDHIWVQEFEDLETADEMSTADESSEDEDDNVRPATSRRGRNAKRGKKDGATGSARFNKTILPGQVLAVVDIALPTRGEDGNFIHLHAAFVDVLTFCHGGAYNRIHGMLEVQTSLPSDAKKGRLGSQRFYNLESVLRSAHIVPSEILGPPTSTPERQRYFVNNYFDWWHYNKFYSPTWEKDGLTAAQEAAKEFAHLVNLKPIWPAYEEDYLANTLDSDDDDTSGSTSSGDDDEAAWESDEEEDSAVVNEVEQQRLLERQAQLLQHNQGIQQRRRGLRDREAVMSYRV